MVQLYQWFDLKFFLYLSYEYFLAGVLRFGTDENILDLLETDLRKNVDYHFPISLLKQLHLFQCYEAVRHKFCLEIYH